MRPTLCRDRFQPGRDAIFGLVSARCHGSHGDVLENLHQRLYSPLIRGAVELALMG